MLISYLLIVGVACAFAGGMILEPRGDFGTGFALGFFLGPIGLVIAAIMRANGPAVARSGERKCPQCAEFVKTEAIKCRFCGSELAPVAAAALPSPLSPAPVRDEKDDAGTVIGLTLVGVLVIAVAITIFAQSHGDAPPTLTASSYASPPYDTEHIVAVAGVPVPPRVKPVERQAPRPHARRTVESSPNAIRSPNVIAEAARQYAVDTIGAFDYDVVDVHPAFVAGDGGSGYVDPPAGTQAGAVEVRFVVRSDGSVVGAVGTSGNGDSPRAAAVQAVLGRVYAPGMKGGRTVPVRMTQYITVRKP